MSKNQEQVGLIKVIFSKAEEIGMQLWLDGGWAIDAKLGKITREHDDIDIAFPKDRKSDYLHLVKGLGFKLSEEMDYGFLSTKGEVLLDSEVGIKQGGQYIIEGFPGICPEEKEGDIDGLPIRCIGWEKMYYEFLFMERDVPKSEWKPKHYASLKIIESHIVPERQMELRVQFAVDHPAE